jgi:maleylacetate reductase
MLVRKKNLPMHAFVYTALSARVVFGSGTLVRLGDELTALGCSRALVLSASLHEQQARAIADRLGTSCVGVFAGATMHTPVEVTEHALRVVAALGADCVVSLGGGSTIGLGKAVAWRTDLPQIAIPTSTLGPGKFVSARENKPHEK